MKNCKCRDTITKKQVEYLGRLAELTVEAALGGKNSLSYRVLFRSCCDNLDDDFEEVFGTNELRLKSVSDCELHWSDCFPRSIIHSIGTT